METSTAIFHDRDAKRKAHEVLAAVKAERRKHKYQLVQVDEHTWKEVRVGKKSGERRAESRKGAV